MINEQLQNESNSILAESVFAYIANVHLTISIKTGDMHPLSTNRLSTLNPLLSQLSICNIIFEQSETDSTLITADSASCKSSSTTDLLLKQFSLLASLILLCAAFQLLLIQLFAF